MPIPQEPANNLNGKHDEQTDAKVEFPQHTHGIMVCGFASGKSKLNGNYKMTGKWIEGRPVYANSEESADTCIWYTDGWCLGPKKHLGTSIAMAHNDYRGSRVWLTEKAWKVQVGGSIKDEINVKVVPIMSVYVLGADGSNKALNGCYELKTDLIKLPKSVRDKFQDRPVYKKKEGEGGPHCLWCCDQGWCIGLESDVGSKTCYAASDDSVAVPWLVKTPWKMVRNSIQVSDANGEATGMPYWSDSSNLQVVAAAEAQISGCGVSGGAWNGVYVMREDWAALPFFSRRTFRGRPVFQHISGKQQCIWFSELGWCVGLEKDLGTTRCGIYNKSDSSVPWLCSSPWLVLENRQFSPCETLRVAPVCTEETIKARAERIAKVTSKKESDKAKSGSGDENKVGSGDHGKNDENIRRFEKKVEELETKASDIEEEGKKLCSKFIDVSISVGLTKEQAEARLKEAEAVAEEDSKDSAAKLSSLPPLLQTLVGKLHELRNVMEELVSVKQKLEEAKALESKASQKIVKRIEQQTTETNTKEVKASNTSGPDSLPDLPEPMVKGLTDELKRQIAEAERKLEEGPDLMDSLNPLPVLRDIPLLGDLVSLVAPSPPEEPVHAFEPGRFE